MSRSTSLTALLWAILLQAGAQAQDVDVRPTARANPRDTLERSRYALPIDIVSVGLDAAVSGGGGGFFDDYARLGGTTGSLGVYAAPRLTARLVMTPRLRIIIDASYHRSGFDEVYEVWQGTRPAGRYVASVAEELSITGVPLLGGIEYAPLRTQFTTYVGGGGGLAFTNVRWTSSVVHANGGYYRPVTNEEGSGIAPAIRIYAGVDLRFDRLSARPSAFRGIFFEAGWLFLPVTRAFFERIRSAGAAEVTGLDSDSGTLYLGGLTITFGLNLQVLRPS